MIKKFYFTRIIKNLHILKETNLYGIEYEKV